MHTSINGCNNELGIDKCKIKPKVNLYILDNIK